MRLKTIIIIATIGFGASLANGATVTNLECEGELIRKGNLMEASLDIDFSGLKLPSKEALVLQPVIVNGEDSLKLAPVGIYGRRRYISYIRNMGMPISGDSEIVMKSKDAPIDYHYLQTVEYRDWMNGASLILNYNTYGCCNTLLSSSLQSLSEYEEFVPLYLYARPQGDASKVCQLSGSAFIDFPVNKTVIYPDYRHNTAELAKIGNTIDSIRGDSDYTITEVWLKGFASPESHYAHNSELAEGRVDALKAYIRDLYDFDRNIIATAFEPEDWEGLIRFLESDGASIANAGAILEIARSESMEPDEKERLIKTRFPADYKYMLANWFPALRHTDYRITYEVRHFYDPKEIARIMATSPQKLSLNELYLLSNSYEPGSKEFNEVFETAVRLFPTDPTANLNAALNAMQRGDLTKADYYLAKAGTSPHADYAKGLSAALRQDYGKGLEYLQKSAEAGLPEAKTAWENLRRHLHAK